METAACLSKNGLEVTLVFPEKHLMERLFTAEMAAFYEKVYTDKGIKLLPGSLAASFEGKDGHVSTLNVPLPFFVLDFIYDALWLAAGLVG